jgi:esterase/lipase superfamily enzyme
MRCRLFVFAGLIAIAGVGQAAEEFIHTAQQGDHPWNIAQCYLRDTSDALRLTRLKPYHE